MVKFYENLTCVWAHRIALFLARRERNPLVAFSALDSSCCGSFGADSPNFPKILAKRLQRDLVEFSSTVLKYLYVSEPFAHLAQASSQAFYLTWLFPWPSKPTKPVYSNPPSRHHKGATRKTSPS